VQAAAYWKGFFFALHLSVVTLIAGRFLELAMLASRCYQNRVPSAVLRLQAHPKKTLVSDTGSLPKKAA